MLTETKLPDTITLYKNEGIVSKVKEYDKHWRINIDDLNIGISKEDVPNITEGQHIALYLDSVVAHFHVQIEQIFLDGKRVK